MNETTVDSQPPSSRPPGRRSLLRSYVRDEGAAGTALALLWTVLALALAGLLVLVDVAQVMYGNRGAESIGLSVVVGALLWLLAIVEGSELAVARLLASDPEELTAPGARRTLGLVQRDPRAFFNGRQALVVTSIVIMTLTVAEIARIREVPAGTGHGLVVFLNSWLVHAAVVFGIPNFMVLWVSQLYPKLRAASDPSGRFMLASYQSVVRGCMKLEETSRLGAPTTILGILKDRVLLTGAATDAVEMGSEVRDRTDPALATGGTESPTSAG